MYNIYVYSIDIRRKQVIIYVLIEVLIERYRSFGFLELSFKVCKFYSFTLVFLIDKQLSFTLINEQQSARGNILFEGPRLA